jgi:hypothetical protein
MTMFRANDPTAYAQHLARVRAETDAELVEARSQDGTSDAELGPGMPTNPSPTQGS